MKPFFRVYRTLALLIFLASCAPTTLTVPVTPTLNQVERPTPTEEILADCIWSGTAFVWIDQNGDGQYQEGEQPVPDVSVLIDDTLNGYTDVGEQAKTSLGGETDLSVWLPGCPDVEFEVYIQVPDGYTLTTPSRVKVGYDDRSSFGLTYLPGIATATPLPPSPICSIYPFPRNRKFADFSIDSDGTIWVGTESNGVYRQLAGQTEWAHWEARDYLISGNIWGIEAKHGYVWVYTPYGVSTLVGDEWQSYTEQDGLISDIVFDVAIEQDGSAWFVTKEGISYFSYADKKWRSFFQIPGVTNSHLQGVDIASDGTVWFVVELSTVLRLRWPDHRSEPEWQMYSTRPKEKNAIDVPFLPTWNFAADEVGNVWFVGFSGFTRFNVWEETWTPQSFNEDIYYLDKEFWQITPDIDGSIWIADQSRFYHYFPVGAKANEDVMLEYSISGIIPNPQYILTMEVGPDGKVWVVMERQIYACEFFD